MNDEEVSKILSDAFTVDSFDRMLLMGTGIRREDITLGENLPSIVSDVVQAARRGGWIAGLVTAAYSHNPGNKDLQALVQKSPFDAPSSDRGFISGFMNFDDEGRGRISGLEKTINELKWVVFGFNGQEPGLRRRLDTLKDDMDSGFAKAAESREQTRKESKDEMAHLRKELELIKANMGAPGEKNRASFVGSVGFWILGAILLSSILQIIISALVQAGALSF